MNAIGSYVDLGDVNVEIECELGRKKLTLAELARLREGDVIPLDKLAGEAFDINVNGQAFAEGEIVVVTDLMAVRITRMINGTGIPDSGGR